MYNQSQFQIKEIAEKLEIRTGLLRVGDGSGLYLYDVHFLRMMKLDKDCY